MLIAAALAAVGAWRLFATRAPTRPVDDEPIASALTNPQFHWDSVSTPQFTIYASSGSYPAARIASYRPQVDSAISGALAILGESAYPAHLRVFYVASRDEIQAVTGMPGMGIARAAYNSVVMVVDSSSPPYNRHEIMHAVSLRLWGQPGGPAGDARESAETFYPGGWMREGIATAAQHTCAQWTNRAVVARMLDEHAMLPLDTLTEAFYKKDEVSAYLQGGTLVDFLLETYGRDAFKRLWRAGPRAMASIYGKDAAIIEAEWHTWLKATPAASTPPNVAELRKHGC